MPTQALEVLLVLLLTVLFLGRLVELARFNDHPALLKKAPRHGPRPLRPRTPDDCQLCRDATNAPLPAVARIVVPYAQRKSHRGRKKTIDTRGQACPNPDCDFRDITDPAVHPATLRFGDYCAVVGYGHHGRQDPIQDFYCQACHRTPALAGGAREFSARRYTPLYRLRSPAARVAQVLHAVAEGLSSQAAARVFQVLKPPSEVGSHAPANTHIACIIG